VKGAPTATGDWRRHRHASAVLAAALAGLIAALLAMLEPGRAQAQSSPRPSITVATTIAAEAATQAPFPIGVGPPGALPRNSFVRVRGLPPMAALSDGHSIAPGAWAIALGALPNLKITLPAGSIGRSEIVITLVAVDGTVLAEERSVLSIAAARQSEKAQTRPDPPPPASASILRAGAPLQTPPEAAERPRSAPPQTPQAAHKPLAPQEKERAQRLMAKGDEQLALGDVASARLFYERAADAGYAPAAMALAATFDAAELERLKVLGIPADAKAARRWYQRARELGASGAEERLRRLGAK
jgi:hypothetical protein